MRGGVLRAGGFDLTVFGICVETVLRLLGGRGEHQFLLIKFGIYYFNKYFTTNKYWNLPSTSLS